MRRRTKGAGYTITETLIVLATTTLLFSAVVLTFSGRQARAEFTQAVRDYEARLQNTISDVTNGVYEAVDCSASSTGVTFDTNTPGSCIFVGKTLRTDDDLKGSTIDTLVGWRGSANQEVTNFTQAMPVAIGSGARTYNHTFQLEVRRMVAVGGSGARYTAVGFIVPFAGSADIGTDQSAGSRQVSLYALPTGGDFPAGMQPAAGGIKLCLKGQNGQRAEIVLGAEGGGSSLTSTLDTADAGECAGAY